MPTQLQIGSMSLRIPDYVVCLSDEEIKKVRSEGQPSEKIIGSGVHADGKVTLILASGEIKIFNPAEYFIPEGPYIPQDDGYTVFLSNTNNRWPAPVKGFSVQSSWLIQKSSSAFVGSELLVNNKSLGKFDFVENKNK